MPQRVVTPQTDHHLVVDTDAGAVEGTLDHGVPAWLGIPYARPPVGELRFRPPQPMPPWPGVRPATMFGNIARQLPVAPDVVIPGIIRPDATESEDCLYLNVWSPAADDHRRPVLVWFHPGGNTFGAGVGAYEPRTFARKHGLVLVTINHRLGPWGFLHLATIDSDFSDTKNLGVLDHLAALGWVQRNIVNFGGDPDNVTIFGLSGGGFNVGTLLTVPAARGLFHKAALYSGRADLATSHDIVAHRTRQFTETLAHIGDLRTAPNSALRYAQNTLLRRYGRNPYFDLIDGDIIPRRGLDAIGAGACRDIPLLVSVTAEEGDFFTFTLQEKELSVIDYVGDMDPEVLGLRTEYRKAIPDVARADARLVGDLAYYGPAFKLIDAQHRAGGKAWMQVYDYVPSTAVDPSFGAMHGSDMPSLFLSEETSDHPDDIASAAAHQEPLVTLARHGVPSSSYENHWDPYTADNKRALIITTTAHAEEFVPRPAAQIDLTEPVVTL
ncbi:carboxylesterase/lipase family protein [Nocardia transvalensis]|uniref:carboxylesterase/lipase family protein n=1 Tax=Nocardia transvalensis TaxID=37333 RepID=UPI001894F376|nr:carboxylesterase family protein [Nocardia transvalensis]MBF6329854.1 carboxylesterase/lipase family protein [Nocardia transvalensis]